MASLRAPWKNPPRHRALRNGIAFGGLLWQGAMERRHPPHFRRPLIRLLPSDGRNLHERHKVAACFQPPNQTTPRSAIFSAGVILKKVCASRWIFVRRLEAHRSFTPPAIFTHSFQHLDDEKRIKTSESSNARSSPQKSGRLQIRSAPKPAQYRLAVR